MARRVAGATGDKGGRGRGMGALVTAVAVLLALVLSGGCATLQAAFAPPLPPAETLGLQAQLLPGLGGLGGTRMIRISWQPPHDQVDLVVVEQADSAQGPWKEIKAVRPERGFHEESSIFRPGRFYYFRAFLVRGNEETPPSAPLSVWIPYAGPEETPTPGAGDSPTPTPGVGQDIITLPTPTPTPVGTRVSPFG